MNMFEIGGLLLLASILVGAVVTLFRGENWSTSWLVAIDGSAAIGIFLMLIGGGRALIEWWPT